MPVNRRTRHSRKASTLEDLEALPGPSTKMDLSKLGVTDICLLKRSDDFGLQAAVSSTSGYHWVDLRELQKVAPDIWMAYEEWYFDAHDRHPLSEISPSEDSSTEEESDEPAADWNLPKSRLTLRTIRWVYHQMTTKSAKYRDTFYSAGASTQSAVGFFIYMKRTFHKWRTLYLTQVNPLHFNQSIFYARNKQLTAGLNAFKNSTTASKVALCLYKQLSWLYKARWFNYWQVNSQVELHAIVTKARIKTFLIRHKFTHWYHWSIEHGNHSARILKIQKLMTAKLNTYLLSWRIYTRAFNANVRKPLRNSLTYWILSSSLSSKVNLFIKWKLRDAFNRLCLKERFTSRHYFRHICFTTWRNVSALHATDVFLTNIAFNHLRRSLIVQAWHVWSSTNMQDRLTYNDFSQAIQYRIGLYFEKWKQLFSHNIALERVIGVAEDHFNFAALYEALLIWADSSKNRSSEAESITSATTHRRITTIGNSWDKWIHYLQLAHEHQVINDMLDSKRRDQAFEDWRERFKCHCARLELFESHLECCHPTIFSWLDSSSPDSQWQTNLIAKAHLLHQSLPLIKSAWRLWYRQCRPVNPTYARLLRYRPDSALQWLDDKSVARFMGMLKNRCRSINSSVPSEREAKAKAITNILLCKRLAFAFRECFNTLKQNTDGQQSGCSTDDSDIETDEHSHPFYPAVTRAWKALRNLTFNAHNACPPAPHMAAPVNLWSLKLKSSVSVMKEFTKLKSIGKTLDHAVLQRIPTISNDDCQLLLRPYRLWMTSLSQQEYDSADKCEIIASYTFTWCLPLWIDVHEGEKSVTLWDCCINDYTNVPTEACLTDSESDEALADQFLTFQGMSFAEPRDNLEPFSTVLTPFTIRGLTQAEAVSVSHAASPSSAPKATNLAKDETATNEELLKLANREAAALLRSPFSCKEGNPTNSTAPPIQQGNLPSHVATNLLSNSGLPTPPLPIGNNTSTELRCYNPSCGKAYEGSEQKCSDCNFPRDRTSFYGPCGHLTDPAKKWCQHPGCSAVNTHFLSMEQQA